MVEESDFETYLRISSNEFEICLFDTNKCINLYEQKYIFDKKNNLIDFKILDQFLEGNIFKIEKSIGKFISNISIIIEYKAIFKVDLGIKKKTYEKFVNKKNLEKAIIEAKDIFKENYQQEKIMHIVIISYLINGNYYSSISDNLKSDNFCLEIEFRSISFNFMNDIEKILKKYHIKIDNYLDGNYIKNFYHDTEMSFSKAVYDILRGCNENEVKLIPKNTKKTGFFEKFFQLFS